MKSIGIPYKTVKRILSNNGKRQISIDSVEFIKSYLDEELRQICRVVEIEYNARNKFREYHGLPPKVRFDVTLYKNVVVSTLSTPSRLKHEGEEANSVYTPLSSDARIEVV